MNSGTVLDFSMSKSSAPTATQQPTPTPPPRQLPNHGLPFPQLEGLSIGNLSLAALSSLLVKAAVSAAAATNQGQPQPVPQSPPTFVKDYRFSSSIAAEPTVFASSVSSAFEPIVARVNAPIYSNSGATMDSALNALLQRTAPPTMNSSPTASMRQQSAFATLTAAALASSRGVEQPPPQPVDITTGATLLPQVRQNHEQPPKISSAAAKLGLKLLDEEDEENVVGFTSSAFVSASSPVIRKPNSKRLRLDSTNGFPAATSQPQQQPLSLASPPPTPTRSSAASTASCVSSTQNSPVSASALRRQQHHSSSANSTTSTGGGTRTTPQRRPAAPIPDSLKDEAYYERRKKNNDAAKRSRDSRRQKEEETAQRACFLEQENVQLRTQVNLLKTEIAKLHALFLSNGGIISNNNNSDIVVEDANTTTFVPRHHIEEQHYVNENSGNPILLSVLSGKSDAFEREKRGHCRELFPSTEEGVEKRQGDMRNVSEERKTLMCADANVTSLSLGECDKNNNKLGEDVGSD